MEGHSDPLLLASGHPTRGRADDGVLGSGDGPGERDACMCEGLSTESEGTSRAPVKVSVVHLNGTMDTFPDPRDSTTSGVSGSFVPVRPSSRPATPIVFPSGLLPPVETVSPVPSSGGHKLPFPVMVTGSPAPNTTRSGESGSLPQCEGVKGGFRGYVR